MLIAHVLALLLVDGTAGNGCRSAHTLYAFTSPQSSPGRPSHSYKTCRVGGSTLGCKGYRGRWNRKGACRVNIVISLILLTVMVSRGLDASPGRLMSRLAS